ncbi:MAG: hypothetical protein U0271_19490 [Polyangiaceae bacterium]
MQLGRSLAVALAALPTFAVLASASAESAAVKEANATCMTATAVLLTGDGADEATRVDMMRKAISTNRAWTLVSERPNNRVGDVALAKSDIKHTYRGGPTVAYTVLCGHGGTCNDVAKKFRELYPTLSPAPVVECGDVEFMLSAPQIIP